MIRWRKSVKSFSSCVEGVIGGSDRLAPSCRLDAPTDTGTVDEIYSDEINMGSIAALKCF